MQVVIATRDSGVSSGWHALGADGQIPEAWNDLSSGRQAMYALPEKAQFSLVYSQVEFCGASTTLEPLPAVARCGKEQDEM